MTAGQATIIGSRVDPASGYRYQMDVTSEGAVPISGVFSVSTTTGSQSYIYGKSGTGWIEVLVDSAGKVETTASVTVDSVFIASGADIGSVYIKPDQYINVVASGTHIPISGVFSVSVDSVFIASGADIGSVYLKDGAFVNVITSGTTGLPISGVVTVGDVAGSMAITTDPLPVSGNYFPGSVYQGTDPWIVLGSTQITNDVLEISGNVTVTDGAYTAGSTNIVDGGFISVIASGTTGIPISGETTTTQGTDPWIVLGSVNVDNAADIGSLGTQNIAGSVAISTSPVQVSGDVTISDGAYVTGSVNIIDGAYVSIAASGTTGVPISGETTTTQGTDPWIVLGSAQVTNDVLEISGNVTVTDGGYRTGSVAITTIPVPVSGEVSVAGDWIPFDYGYMFITYTGSEISNTAYFDSSGGSLLGSLSVSYDAGSNIVAIERSVV